MSSLSAQRQRTLPATDAEEAGFTPLPQADDGIGRLLSWLAGAVIVLVLAGTAALLGTLREDALDAAETSIARTNFLLAENLDGAFRSIDLTLADTAAALAAGAEDRAGPEARRDWLRARIATLPMVQRLSFSDAAGRVTGTSENMVLTGTSIADRSYFTALASGTGTEPVVSEPVQSRADGQWAFIVARRVSGADGSFLGAVWAAISLNALDRLFAAAAPEPGARVTLLRGDMVMLARRPYIPGRYGQSVGDTPTYAGIFADGRTAGSGRFYSVLDHDDRVAAAKRLSRYPFVVSVAVLESAVLAPWRQLAALVVAGALATCGAILAVLWTLLGQRRRLQSALAGRDLAETALQEERSRLASVVAAAGDGFWEWHLDTGMVDWSERCCALMGMPAAGGVLHIEQVVGMLVPEDLPSYRLALRRHFDEGQPFAVEARWRTFDGSIRWMASRGNLLRHARGRPLRMIGANTDITDCKRPEHGHPAVADDQGPAPK